MKTVQSVFLDDIIEHPTDDAPRLVYADWLEDNGDLTRAEFVRVQVELARTSERDCGGYYCETDVDDGSTTHRGCRWDRLRRRERELLLAHGHDWLAGIGIKMVCHDGGEAEGVNYEITTGTEKGGGIQCNFRRGFVDEVRLPLAAWVGVVCPGNRGLECCQTLLCPTCNVTGRTGAHGVELVRAQPITRVEVSDREPYSLTPGEIYGWYAEDLDMSDGLRAFLPNWLWELLPPGLRGYEGKYYKGEGAAESYLSKVLLAWVRQF